MWAKYKPTCYPSPFPDDWYRAVDNKDIAPNEIITVDIGSYALLEGKSYKAMLYVENKFVDQIPFAI